MNNLDKHTLGYPIEIIFVFTSLVVLSLWLDIRSHRGEHDISLKNAIGWSLFWIGLAIGFFFYLWVRFGEDFADLFMAGYLLEKTLSVDNLMLFVVIFSSFGVKGGLQHRVLYYGILGAILFRFLFIWIGTAVFGLSTWVQFLFAAIVAWTGWKMLCAHGQSHDSDDFSDHWSVQLTRRFLPIYPKMMGNRFFVSREQALLQGHKDHRHRVVYATPLFLCLICIEASDIMFAFDSVPAIIAVTREPLLVYSSIIFAILGLRSLYFVLVVLREHLSQLDRAVALLLFFIALKLTLEATEELWSWPHFKIGPSASLLIILGTLTLGVIASLFMPAKKEKNILVNH